jgi:hypothetical protein
MKVIGAAARLNAASCVPVAALHVILPRRPIERTDGCELLDPLARFGAVREVRRGRDPILRPAPFGDHEQGQADWQEQRTAHRDETFEQLKCETSAESATQPSQMTRQNGESKSRL